MLSILINAYACSPDMGSEPGLAWNWCINLASHCELHIITEGEFRNKIESVLPILSQAPNIHFYYNPVSDEIRKMCWNQGDWRFYYYYRKWQKKTLNIALNIIQNNHIDIIHQLNMNGFREPGYLWKIKNIPFVWGPVGGLRQFPVAYLYNANITMILFNLFKNMINILQIKYNIRVRIAIYRADLLLSTIPDSYNAIKKYHNRESIIVSETGGYFQNNVENLKRFDRTGLNLIWVGKFDFRKQLEIAIRTIAELKHLNGVKLNIYGTGSQKQIKYYRKLTADLNVNEQIKWHGNRPNQEILEHMKTSQLFFFTSVSDDTPVAVLESLSAGLPVICFDACGFGYVVNDAVGLKIKFSNPAESVKEFAEKIEYLYYNREKLKEMALNCIQRQKELSWENKAKQMLELYEQAIANYKNCRIRKGIVRTTDFKLV
jgi:glycosyltransferase involved in cell wall biosynthesis